MQSKSYSKSVREFKRALIDGTNEIMEMDKIMTKYCIPCQRPSGACTADNCHIFNKLSKI